MAPRRSRGEVERLFATMLPPAVARMRRQLGWTQKDLGARSGISQPRLSRFEAGRIEVTSLSETGRLLDSLGIRVQLRLDDPLVARSDRQHDLAHARCLAYVAGRVAKEGWDVRREVEIHHGRSHGWIDLLAFHAASRSALVAEIKSELPDVGAIQRTLSWYARMAWDVGRSFGWPIRGVGAALMVLATEANEARILDNGALLRQAFPVRGSAFSDWLAAPIGDMPGAALALIDPRSRRERWVISTASDGRRSSLRYAGSADFLRRLRTS